MKAEERKEIETNSMVLAYQKLRQRVTGRTLYYVIGVVLVIVAGILIYRYMTHQSATARDAILLQLDAADTPEKLKQGMEDHRGTLYGSLFKKRLAEHELLNEGLPKLGTDRMEDRKRAAASVEAARGRYLELTSELKQKEEPALVQIAWHEAGRAEEALVGFPTTDGGPDSSRGNLDKAIEYYTNAASIFPDSEISKSYKAWAEKLKANKVQMIATQKEIYKQAERPVLPPLTKDDPFPGLPGLPPPPKTELPGAPKLPAIPGDPKIEVPAIPKPADIVPPPMPDPKKTPEPEKPTETPKPADPKKTPEPTKPADPKADPKAK
ncbi:MAG TPA: hypothetical protein VHR66_29615 [Gemmataceae bacterium]|jgi:hypothetical protein|nr:hypothetical protein [Gemmataceae bacterium]